MKVGDTGTVILGGKSPSTNDCFWRAQILDMADDGRLLVHLESGDRGWIEPSNFKPMYMYKEQP